MPSDPDRPRRRRPIERGGRPVLTEERVRAAALELFGEGGLSAVTMRALAARLGVTARSIYNYVEDRRQLLTGVALDFQRLLPMADATEDLRADVEGFAAAMRTLGNRYPDALSLGLVEGIAPISEPFLESMESVLRMLVGHGLSPADAYLAATALNQHVWSVVLFIDRAPAFDYADASNEMVGALSQLTTRFPLLAEVGATTAETQARHGLEILLDWIEAHVRR